MTTQLAQTSGNIPPQAIELEKAILGAILIEKDALSIVLDILTPESFYDSSNGTIYAAMIELFEKSHPIDMLTVTEQLKLMGELERVGGAYKVVELTNMVGSAANIEYHARIVSQKHIQRKLIKLGYETVKKAFDESNDVLELLEEVERGVFEVATNQSGRDFHHLSKIVSKTMKVMEGHRNAPDGITGIGTGLIILDKATNGWQNSDFIIIAARPGMGKTGLLLQLAKNAAQLHKKSAAIFSLEMSSIQLNQRLIAMDTGISVSKIMSANLTDQEWHKFGKSSELVSELNIFIDDTPGLNIFQLRSKARRLKMKEDVDIIFVDYLQLMTAKDKPGRNREQEVSEISRSLKVLAKELNVPVIALSQLSRAVEIRGGSKRPMLSDLRESGSLEQDADGVIFIYRSEYYDILEDEDGQSLKGVAELILAKFRNGKPGTLRVRFIDHTTGFVNLDPYEQTVTENYNPVIEPSKLNDDEDLPF